MTQTVTDFDLAKWLQKRMLTCFGEFLSYPTWPDDLVLERIQHFVKEVTQVEGWRSIDPTKLTKEQAKILGFGDWDGSGSLLIPIWMAPFLKPGIELRGISGEKFQWTHDTDKDHRFGSLAYGVQFEADE